MTVAIREASPGDEAAWRRLWSDYTAFYRESVPADVTAATWSRILDPASPVLARLAERAGVVVGFAVCVLHEGTWTAAPICYLEDLFVAPQARGGGVGRALIDDLLRLAAERGWSRLYWHTNADNAAARRLYDTYVAADDYVRYRLFLEP